MNTPDISPVTVIGAPDLRLLLRREGRGKAIKNEAAYTVSREIADPRSNLPFIKSKHVPLFAARLIVSIVNLYAGTKGCMDPCVRPATARPPVNSDQWPIVNARCTFCFRLTARSLRIQKAVIFTPSLLYLEVNGCQETNEAARNSCASSRRRGWCEARGERKTFFCFDERSHTHTHTNLLSLPSGLARAISQSRFSLAYYIFTYSRRFRMMENVAAHYLASQLLQGSNS